MTFDPLDFCLMSEREWLLITAALLGAAVAIGIAFSVIGSRRALSEGPTVVGFGLGFALPVVLGIGLVFGLERALHRYECGFTPDTVGLGAFIVPVPVVIILIMQWRSRRK